MKLRHLIPLLLLIGSPGLAQKVVVKGSNTFGEELAPALITGFRALKPEVTVELESKGSGSGIQALLDGTCDIAASSRAMNEDELRLARSRRVVLRNSTIGYYGVAVVVHPDNPVRNLTDPQVRDLFTGAIANWKDVGGPDAPVHVYIRDPVSGTYLGFQELAMERKPYVASARMFTGYHAMARAMLEDRNAIGYVGMTLAAHNGVRAVTINGVEATAQNVADQLYPYARQLRLYTDHKHVTPETKAFITFVRSTTGQTILHDLGFARRSQLRLTTRDDVP